MFIKRVSLLLIGLSLSASLNAEPDVGFSDSGSHGGAYLEHEFRGDDIKFVLSAPILNYRLPDKFYDLEALQAHIQRRAFTDDQLKDEFISMLESSFCSQFKAQKFLDELVQVLSEFDQ